MITKLQKLNKKVTRVFAISDINPELGEHSMDIKMPHSELKSALDYWSKGDETIQDVFPNLTASEREFLLDGVTPEEWEQIVTCGFGYDAYNKL